MASILGAEVEFSPSVNAAVVVGNRRHVNPGFATLATGAIKLIGADVDQRVGVAVICMLWNDDVIELGVRPRQAEGKFVRLAPRIHEITNLEWLGQSLRKPFCVTNDIVMQVT